MRKNIISIGFGMFLVVSFLSVPASAQMGNCWDTPGWGMRDGRGMMHHRGEGMGPGMMMSDGCRFGDSVMQLGLDAKQKEKFRTIRETMMKDMVRKRADLQIAAIELNDLLDQDPVNMKAVEAALKKKAALKSDMELAHIKAHEAMKALLTPEQHKRLKEMREAGACVNCPMKGPGPGPQDMPMRRGPMR